MPKKGEAVSNVSNRNQDLLIFWRSFFVRNSLFYGGLALVFLGKPTAAIIGLKTTWIFLIVVILFDSGSILDGLAQKKFVFFYTVVQEKLGYQPGLRLSLGHFLIVVMTLVF